MMKNKNKLFINNFVKDFNNIISELLSKGLIRDFKSNSINDYNNSCIIKAATTENESNILYDKHLPIDSIMDTLLENKEYNILLYDRSIIKYEFTIVDGKILKERLFFIKKHNYLWDKTEIQEKDNDEFSIDWFQEESGIPVVIRIDYDKTNFEDVIHPITHMTLSNYEECRIPMMGSVTLYNFINFVLNFFYNEKLDFNSVFSEIDDMTITDNEKRRLHFEWM